MTYAEQRALERALIDGLLKSLRPAMDEIVAAFRQELARALASLATTEAAPGQRKGYLGRPKSCAVCKLKNARNDAALPAEHTQEQHRRWKSGAGGSIASLPRRERAPARGKAARADASAGAVAAGSPRIAAS